MSLSNTSNSGIEKLWKSYIKSPSSEFFMSSNFEKPFTINEGTMVHDKKLKRMLLSQSETFLSEFSQHHLPINTYQSKLEEKLCILQESVQRKMYKDKDLRSVFALLFEVLNSLISDQSAPLESVVRVVLTILLTIKIIILSLPASEQFGKKSLILLHKFYESMNKPENQQFALLHVENEESFRRESISCEYVDVIYSVLECYLASLKTHYPYQDVKSISSDCFSTFTLIKKSTDLYNYSHKPSSILGAGKFSLILEILIIGLKPIEFASIFRDFSERFKEIFCFTVRFYLINCTIKRGISMKDDLQPLARIFYATYRAILLFSESPEDFQNACDFPVLLLHVLLSQLSGITAQEEKEILQQYILEFLHMLYCDSLKNIKASLGINLEELLFSKFLFEINDETLNDYWARIWNTLCSSINDFKYLESVIHRNLSLQANDFSYLCAFNQWITSTNQAVLQKCVDFGLVEHVLSLISNGNMSEDITNILFQIATSLLSICQTRHEKIVNIVLYEIVARHEEYLEYCDNILALLLNMKNVKILEKFVAFFRQVHTPAIVICLIKSLVRALNNRKSSDALKEFLVKSNFDDNLQGSLPEIAENIEETLEIWRGVFECLELIKESRDSIEKYITFGFDYWHVVWILRNNSYDACRERVVKETMESLINIVKQKDSLLLKVHSPLPLLSEYLCCLRTVAIFESTEQDILAFPNNFMFFLKYGLMSNLIYHLEACASSEFWRRHSRLINEAIKFGISLPDFSQLIRIIIAASNPALKSSLLEVLVHALSIPNKSIYSTKSLILSNSDSFRVDCFKENLAVSKNFTVSTWIYIESGRNQLFEIKFTVDSLSMLVHDSILLIKFNGDMIFQRINTKLHAWNFIAVTFNSITIAKVLRKKKISLYLWNDTILEKQKVRCRFSKRNIIQFIDFGGKDLQFREGIQKQNGFSIFTKSLDEKELLLLQNLGINHSLFNLPLNPSVSELKTINELREALLFDFDISSSYSHSLLQLNNSRYYFQDSNIRSVILLYDPKKLLIELLDASTEIQDLIKVYEIFYRIICQCNDIHKIDKEFIRYLSYAINSKMIDNKIHEIYCLMIEDSAECYSKILFRYYINNQKCIFLLGKSGKIEILIERYTKYFPFSRKNLYKLCVIINGIDDILASQVIKKYLSKDFENKSRDEIANSLIPLLELEKPQYIKFILESLKDFKYNLGNASQITTVLIYLFEKCNFTPVQILILEILLVDDKEDDSEIDTQEKAKLLEVVIAVIPDQMQYDLSCYMLKVGFRNTRNREIFRLRFVDVVMEKLMNIDDIEIIRLVLVTVYTNKAKISSYIYDRDIFPYWLISFCKRSQFTEESLELAYTIFYESINRSQGDIMKSLIFFQEFPNIALYLQIFSRVEFTDIKSANQYFSILFTFDNAVILANIDKVIGAMQQLQNTEGFMKLLLSSLDINSLIDKVQVASLDNPKNLEKNKGKFLIGQFIKFCIKIIKISPTNNKAIKLLSEFLSLKSINYFCNYSDSTDQSKAKFEEYISVYIFYYLLKLYDKHPDIYSEYLEEFTKRSKVFDKLSNIMRPNTSEVIFEKLTLTDNAALLDQSTEYALSLDYSNRNRNARSMQLVGDNYETLSRNSTNFHKLINRGDPIPSIMKHKDWPELREKFTVMIKNYNKMDKALRVLESFVVDSQPQYSDLGKILSVILSSILKDPWKDIYLQMQQRSQYMHQRNYEKYKKLLARVEYITKNPQPEHVCIRQCYDNQYRWVFLKPAKHIRTVTLKQSQHILPKRSMEFKVSRQIADSEDSLINPFSIEESLPEMYGSPERNQLLSCNEFFTCEAEYIKVQGSYFGSLLLDSKYIEFSSTGELKANKREYIGSALSFSWKRKVIKYAWKPKEISEIILRRFMHRHTAIEIVIKSGKSYLFNVFTESLRGELIAKLPHCKSHNVKICGKSPQQEIESYTSEWRRGNITNFEYLMIINKLSSRCMHDISQYPIFPWVLTDFSKGSLPFPQDSYRKFNFPVGAQSLENQKAVSEKYSEWDEDDMDAFHYGSHYSSEGVALHFLMRIEPYTSQIIDLQGGSMDVADRLFISLEFAWNSCSGQNGDVKELIPELFYQPFCYNSHEKSTYGVTQAGAKVIDVVYPGWAVSNWDFLKKHRLALESEKTSKEINSWIDLIFGFKQQGKAAISALNIFCAVTYESLFMKFVKSQDSNYFESIVEQVYHFGQTPMCLFPKKIHPCKDEMPPRSDFDEFLYAPQAGQELTSRKKENCHNGQAHAIFILQKYLIVIKSLNHRFYLMKYPFKSGIEVQLVCEKTCILQHYPVHSLELYSQCLSKYNINFVPEYSANSFAIFKKSYLISGYHPSYSLLIHNFKGQLVSVMPSHTNLITSVSATSECVFSASLDTSVVCCRLGDNLLMKKRVGYLGHTSAVTGIKTLESYCVVITAAVNGVVLLHDIRTGECLKKITEKCIALDVCELGIIAIGGVDFVRYFGLNGDSVSESKVDGEVKLMKFSGLGEYCFEVSEENIVVRDPTDPSKKIEVIRDAIVDIAIDANRSHAYVCVNINGRNETAVFLVKITSERQEKGLEKLMKDLL